MLEFSMVKKEYFRPEMIEAQARSMRAEALNGQSIRHALRLNQTGGLALLVLDMQDYFLESSSHACVPSAKAIVPGIQRLIQAFHRKKLPLVFTRHVNTSQNAHNMATWWREVLQEDHPLSQITSNFDTSLGTVLIKSQYDAFFQTPLETILQEKEVRQVVICGVVTHLCCETTARSGFVRGFEVAFPVDGTATYNRSFHLASLRNLAHGFAHLVTMAELLKELERANEA